MKQIRSDKLSEAIKNVMESVAELLTISAEYTPSPDEEEVNFPFELSSQFERPSEFIQCLLDMIRANFEPHIMGTLFLNSNMDFLYNSMQSSDIGFGYLSLIKTANLTFREFWHEHLLPKAKACGYDLDETPSIFISISANSDNYSFELIEELGQTVDAHMNTKETLSLLSSLFNDETPKQKEIHAGYCLDESLGSQIRVSMWFVKNIKEPKSQH